MENQGLLWSLLFDQISDGVCVSAPEDTVLYMNPAARRMLGLPAAWRPDRTLCDLLCASMHASEGGDCASGCPVRPAGAPEESTTRVGRYESLGLAVSRGLRVRCLKMPSVLMDATGKPGHLTIIEDVSQEISFAQEKEDWRHMIAHDLRTPLTSVFGMLRLLQDGPKGALLGQAERQQLAIGVRGCERMIELLDLYLDVAKLEAGAMPVAKEELDLARLVRDCVKLAGPFARTGGVRLSASVGVDARAAADAELTRRILDNLINNALKFTPKGGTVVVSAGIGPDGGALLSVKDTGPGISREDMPKLFDRFHQAKARREGRLRGTGLGLAFCREAARRMGGEISALSEPGRGSEFVLRLPAPASAPREDRIPAARDRSGSSRPPS